jgi:hypothetical protein
MASNESKNEMLVMVLTDLSAICDKLIDHPAVPNELRQRTSDFVTEFNSLSPVRGKGNPYQHVQGQELLIKIARFLPRLLEVHAEPARVSNG